LEQPLSGFLDFTGGVIITHGSGLVFKDLSGDAGFEILRVMRDGFESLPRCHDLIVRVRFSDLSLCIHLVDSEVTRPVKVEIRIERLCVETINDRGVFLWDMTVSHHLADDSAVFAFG